MHLTILQGDPVSILVDWVAPFIAIAILVAVMMWLLAYASRFFEYLKMQESRWVSRNTLDFVRRFLSPIWVILFSVGGLAILHFRFEPARVALSTVQAIFPVIFFVLFVGFGAALSVRVLHQFAAYLRGELRTKPRQPAPPNALVLTELVLKYVIYGIAGVIAFVGGVQALGILSPPGSPEQWTSAIVILVGSLVIAFLADRVLDSIFQGLKRRTKKLNPRAIDQMRVASRGAVLFVIGFTALFLVLNLVLDSTRLLVVSAGFLTIVILIGVATRNVLYEALTGLSLMVADPFDVGDRVKIGDDLVCDVVGIHLTTTQVRTLRGELVTLPNSRLRLEPIVNFSRSKSYAMFVDVSVGFDVPHARVQEVLLEAARKTPGIVESPAPEVYGKDVAGNVIEYQLLAYTNEPVRMKQIKSALVFNLQDAFQRFGIVPGIAAP